MVSFKQYLQEARMAPLYHASKISALSDIVNHGLKPLTTQFVNVGLDTQTVRGLSLTRSYRFAERWGTENRNFVILHLDQQKLTQRYKIKPWQYFEFRKTTRRLDGRDQIANNEYEEFVITDKTIDLSYVTQIDIAGFVKPNVISNLLAKYPHIKLEYI